MTTAVSFRYFKSDDGVYCYFGDGDSKILKFMKCIPQINEIRNFLPQHVIISARNVTSLYILALDDVQR